MFFRSFLDLWCCYICDRFLLSFQFRIIFLLQINSYVSYCQKPKSPNSLSKNYNTPNTVAEESIYFLSNECCSLLSSNALFGEFSFVGVSRMQDLNSIHSTISHSMLVRFQILVYKLIHSLPNLFTEAMSKEKIILSCRHFCPRTRNCFWGTGVGENGAREASVGGQSGQAVQSL